MQTALLASCSLIEMAIEPKLNADRPKLSAVLFDLAAQDPSFRVTTDADVGQTILGGLSETHLEDKINILKHAYKIDANIGAPQVACREKIVPTRSSLACKTDRSYRSAGGTPEAHQPEGTF